MTGNTLGNNPYNYKIRIIGSFGGTSATFAIALSFSTTTVTQSGTSVCVNHLCFDYSDSPTATWTSSSRTLTWSVSNNFNLDPLAIDGSGTCGTTSSSTSCTITITTTNTNDVIIVGEYDVGSTTSNTNCITPTDSASNSYSQRKRINVGTNTCVMSEYNSAWSSSGSLTITCKFNTHSISFDTCIAFGISGSPSPSSPFNPSAGNTPCTGSLSFVTGTLSCSSTMTNTGVNDLIFGIYACDGGGTNTCIALTVGSGYTTITSATFGSSCSTNICSGIGGESKLGNGGNQNPSFTGGSSLREYYEIGDDIFTGTYIHSLSLTNLYSETLTTISITLSFLISNTYTQTLTSVIVSNEISKTMVYSQTLTTISLSNGLSQTLTYQQSLNQGFDGHCNNCGTSTITETTTGGNGIVDDYNWYWLAPVGLLLIGALVAIKVRERENE